MGARKAPLDEIGKLYMYRVHTVLDKTTVKNTFDSAGAEKEGAHRAFHRPTSPSRLKVHKDDTQITAHHTLFPIISPRAPHLAPDSDTTRQAPGIRVKIA